MFKYAIDVFTIRGGVGYSDLFLKGQDIYKNVLENDFKLYHEDYMSLGIL